MTPNDDISQDLPRARAERAAADPRVQAMLERIKQRAAEEQAPAPAPAAAPAAPEGTPQANQPASEPEQSGEADWNFSTEIWRAVGGGVRDALQANINAIKEADEATRDSWFALRSLPIIGPAFQAYGTSAPQLPEVAKPETLGGQLARPVVQFLTDFVPIMAVMRAPKAASAVVKGGTALAAGAASDYLAFEAYDKRLSNMLLDLSAEYPALRNPITEYLATDEADAAATSRLKNAIEGGILGVAAEAVFKAIRGIRAWHKVRGEDPSKLIKEAEAPAAEPPRGEEADAFDKAPRTGEEPTFADLVEERRAAAAEVERAPRTADPEDYVPPGRPDVEEPFEKAPRTGFDGTPAQFDAARAAADEAPRKAPRTPDPEEVDPEVALRTADQLLDTAIQRVEANAAHRAWIRPDDGEIVFAKERPEGAAIDFDARVRAALEADPATRTAADLVVLRAYRQMQEAAFKGLIVPEKTAGRVFSDEARLALRSPILGADARQPTRALTDAERRAIREEGEEILAAIRANAEKVAAAARKAEEIGKPLVRGRFILDQGGFMSPTLLANMGAASGGALAGLATAPDDATFADRLDRAGMGALAGLGVKVGVSKTAATVQQTSKYRAAKRAEAIALADSLARKEVEGIAPKRASVIEPKPMPRISSEKIDAIADMVQSGRTEEVARTLDESGFNLNNIDSDAELDNLMRAFEANIGEEMSKAARGVRTLADTAAHAKSLGAGIESLNALYRDSANLDARVTAHRILLVASGQNVQRLAQMLQAGKNDIDAMLAFRKAVVLHASLMAKMKGVQTEVARALSAFRIRASAADLVLNERLAMLDALGGQRVTLQLAEKIANVADQDVANAIIRKGALARSRDAVFEAWVNGILSGLRTHTVNITGNSLVALFGPVEKGMAAVIGKLRGGADAITAGEIRAELWGRIEGLMDVFRIGAAGKGELLEAAKLAGRGAVKTLTLQGGGSRDLEAAARIIGESADLGGAWKAFGTGTPQLDSGAHSAAELLAQRNAISASHFELNPDTVWAGAVDYIGALIRTPGGRLLTTSDEVFKTALYRGELRAQAYRIATREGLEGEAKFARIAQLLEDPTGEMQAQALAAAREGTFTRPLGDIGRAVQDLAHVIPGGLGKFIVPFVKTPANILTYVGERTPGLNAISARVREDWAAGGRRRDLVMAQTAMGAMLYTVAGMMAAQGLITGGGDKQRSAERLAGQQQYSLKIGDQYYSFHRLDPIGMFFGLAADMVDLSGNVSEVEMEDLASMAILAIQRNLLSKSYVKGISDVVLAANMPEMYGQGWAERFAGSWVPSWLAQFAREADPHIKEVWNVVDAIKARTPGFSEEVPNHVNLLGEDVKYAGGLGPDIASPVFQMSANPSPLAQEIARLNIDLRHPKRTQFTDANTPGIDLDPWQYYKLMKHVGSFFKQHGEKLVNSEAYKRLPEVTDPLSREYGNTKADLIKRLYSVAVEHGRQKLMQEDKALQRHFTRLLENKRRTLNGLPALPINEN